MKGTLSLRGFRKLRTGAIVATGVFLIGLASVQTTVQASEEDGVWVARTVEQVKADIQKEDNFFKYEIKWGDTLSVISEATNIPVDVLKEMNRVSDRNLFLPHNELLYTEGESVTDSKTKHKIVIKESYGKKEVRTYEVVLQKNHETAEVTFELKETTEKVQASYTSVVSYGEVYNLVSDEAEGTVETPGEEALVTPGATETPTPAETTPAGSGATETPTPAQPAETTPAGSGAAETSAPAQPAEGTPAAPGATETPAPAQPAEETPAAPGTTETPAPAQPAETTPAAPGRTETPIPAQPAEEKPVAPGTTETPAPAQPAEEKPVAPGTTETPATAQPAEGTPAAPGATETPAPAQPAEEKPAAPGATETPTPAQPAEEKPVAPGTTETPTPAQPAEEKPVAPGTTETPTPAQPAEEHPAAPGATETPTPAQPAEEKPATPGTAETPTPAQPAEGTPAAPGATETPALAQPAEGTPAAPGTTETPAPAQPAEENPTAPGATETPTPAQPAEEKPAAPGATETPTPAQPAETAPAGSGATETPTPAQPAEDHPAAPGATETPAPAQPTETTEDTPADSNNQNKPNEPKDDVEKGLKENTEELESRKNIKLKEIESSSLSSSEKEAAKLKVEEYTTKAKEALKQAKTTDNQAAVVDNYSDDLTTINTPGVDQGKPDYTNSGLSGNGPEGTHIGDNNVIGHGNSTPENTGFRNAPVYQPRVTRRARSVDEPKNKVSIYYNYDGMKDIPGFFNDLDSKNEVEVPQKAPAQTLKSILKSKIDQKKAELERKGYKIADEYFVGIDQENATHYDYVVTFTKA